MMKKSMSKVGVPSFKGFTSLSAPYSLTAMQQTFMPHGLDENHVDHIFGEEDQENFDPHRIVLSCQGDGLLLLSSGLLTPIQIYHVSLKRTVPCEGSKHFCMELKYIVTNG
jgi:hypothetical protein